MPLSSAEKTALQTQATTLTNTVEALVVDPDPNPLQVELDAANAKIAAMKAKAQEIVDM